MIFPFVRYFAVFPDLSYDRARRWSILVLGAVPREGVDKSRVSLCCVGAAARPWVWGDSPLDSSESRAVMKDLVVQIVLLVYVGFDPAVRREGEPDREECVDGRDET